MPSPDQHSAPLFGDASQDAEENTSPSPCLPLCPHFWCVCHGIPVDCVNGYLGRAKYFLESAHQVPSAQTRQSDVEHDPERAPRGKSRPNRTPLSSKAKAYVPVSQEGSPSTAESLNAELSGLNAAACTPPSSGERLCVKSPDFECTGDSPGTVTCESPEFASIVASTFGMMSSTSSSADLESIEQQIPVKHTFIHYDARAMEGLVGRLPKRSFSTPELPLVRDCCSLDQKALRKEYHLLVDNSPPLPACSGWWQSVSYADIAARAACELDES
eukprot:TRINITY_DN24236_c0_g2_i1.p1 TRINITY_DN24236_c0_g2~~TRINITY_DN24236_c0_g2_i1.p1  ORF type:complete len:291 (-),score=36.21 TRINITY_DN24236_c0_g2_i1:252-1070(-)